jgi:transposase-like protein
MGGRVLIPVVFCAPCGSTHVDVVGWHDRETAVFRCCRCGHEAHVRGFTIGRAYGKGSEAKALAREAYADRAAMRAVVRTLEVLPGGKR